MAENINNSIQEDEIDLKELFNIIWKNKFKIVFFSFIITSLTIAYTLTIPNSYKSSIVLAPQEQAKPSLGGLGALAGLAGVDLGGGSLDAFTSIQTTLNDYTFNKYIIEKYNLDQKISSENTDKNLVFAMNNRKLYDYLNKKDEEKEAKSKEEIVFNTYKDLQNIISLSNDKKTGTISFSATFNDRFLVKELLEIYLKELISHIRKQDMKDISKKIDYYNKELSSTQDIELKTQLSTVLSGLVQKRVLSQASEFYIVKKLTEPTVPYIKDKVGPKRGLIVVVSFVTSIILGIFLVFFLEFIKGNREKK